MNFGQFSVQEFGGFTTDWFNHWRLLEPIGNVPPVELEATYYRQQEESAEAA